MVVAPAEWLAAVAHRADQPLPIHLYAADRRTWRGSVTRSAGHGRWNGRPQFSECRPVHAWTTDGHADARDHTFTYATGADAYTASHSDTHASTYADCDADHL